MKDIINIGTKLAEIGAISVPKNNSHNCFGDYIEELINEELPFGWVYAKRDFLEPRETKMSGLINNCCKKQTIDKEIEALKEYINFYYKYKKECINLGGCYCKYFSDMYMHCHNSKNKNFEFVQPKEERLLFLLNNYDKLKQQNN